MILHQILKNLKKIMYFKFIQLKELLHCFLFTPFKGDIYIKAKIKYLSHYIIDSFIKVLKSDDLNKLEENKVYENIYLFFGEISYQSKGLHGIY